MALLALIGVHGQNAGTLHGRVLDDIGDPLDGAVVELIGAGSATARKAISGRDGRFVISRLPAGWFQVWCKSLLHRQTLRPTGTFPSPALPPVVDVPIDGDVSVEVGMIRCARVVGHVAYPSGKLAANAWVAVIWPRPAMFVGQQLVKTDAQGYFRTALDGVGKDQLGLEVGEHWYAPLQEVELQPGALRNLRFRLRQTGSISGRVLLTDGRQPTERTFVSVYGGHPFKGCSLAAARAHMDAIARSPGLASTAPDPWHPHLALGDGDGYFGAPEAPPPGAFTIVRPPEGEYTISAYSCTRQGPQCTVTVRAGRTTGGITLTLGGGRPSERRRPATGPP